MNKIKNIRFKGYKVFAKSDYVEMKNISHVNIIIGKNNCGKTSLLDIMETVFNWKSPLRLGMDVESIQFDVPFDKAMIDGIFSGYSGIGQWTATKLTEATEGKLYPINLKAGETVEIADNSFGLSHHINGANRVLASRRGNYSFRKISAERNVYPEAESEPNLYSEGEGASNLIATFLNDSNYDERIIEVDFLDALNRIMKPEAEFESIRVQQVNYDGQRLWEVFLQENGAQRVPLSKTGSGLKSIVLVLLNLLVIPNIKAYSGKRIVYGFEELENNLHPALQRRLFEYLYDFSLENDVILFLTTHSHIAINAFFDKEDTSIYHVIKENGSAKIKCIETHIDKTEILDDLDVKASDILQSNGIIWVEGPSDRIYIKRWLELFTPNNYKEGKHYQFLYYGGRLLSQYSTKEETDLINIITTNRNAAIVIDSDKRYKSAKLNDTKKRIMQEFDKLGMFFWVTKGKEIENYLPKQAIETMQSVQIRKECGQYQLFPDYVVKYYKNFSNKKVPFANKIKDHLTVDNSKDILDLKKQVEKLYWQIKKWNQ
jgi:hypothetical protein